MLQPLTDSSDQALHQALATLQDGDRVPLRTLAHAWTGGGGTIQVGHVSIRLLSPPLHDRPPVTAGFLHLPRAGQPARLEICRVILCNHGLSDQIWKDWCDENAELVPHGLDPAAKYPTLQPARLGPPEMVRAVVALRDLARLLANVSGSAAGDAATAREQPPTP